MAAYAGVCGSFLAGVAVCAFLVIPWIEGLEAMLS